VRAKDQTISKRGLIPAYIILGHYMALRRHYAPKGE
jgi:hypothetical protein